jgi:hypothetical protein
MLAEPEVSEDDDDDDDHADDVEDIHRFLLHKL